MDETFDTVVESSEGAKGDELHDFHFHVGTDGEIFHHGEPGIRMKLFETHADFFGVGIDAQNLYFQFLPFLQHFTGIGDFFGPGQIAHMEQSVYAVFNLHKGAIFGEIANHTFEG